LEHKELHEIRSSGAGTPETAYYGPPGCLRGGAGLGARVGRFGYDTGISYNDLKEIFDSFNETIRIIGKKIA
jgi:hypothetical protein